MLEPFRPGVLGQAELKKLIEDGVIVGSQEKNVKRSAINLTLGNEMWEMHGGIKGNRNTSFSKVVASPNYYSEIHDITSGVVLEPKRTYVVKLKEQYVKEKNYNQLYGHATGRSSIGRLDVLTRMIADYSDFYDELPCPKILETKNEPIDLYIEITPITFRIKIKEGLTLNQLRFYSGRPSISSINGEQAALFNKLTLYNDGKPVPENQYNQLSVDLSPDKNGVSAYKAKKELTEYIDLSASKGTYDPKKFWDPKVMDQDRKTFEIEPEDFYIIRSHERLNLPDDIAVYAKAMTEKIGELRIHYAGFAHPFFGFYREEKNGSPLIFEIRGHNVKTFLRDKEHIAKILFYRMSKPIILNDQEIEEEQKGGYQNQELKLSNYFKDWE